MNTSYIRIGIFIFIVCSFFINSAELSPNKKDLNVAIFAYIPDGGYAIEKIEEAFEHDNPTIDLDLKLWDPYVDSLENDGLIQMNKFDLVEIDICRIDQLINGKYGGLDTIPSDVKSKPDELVKGAKKVVEMGLNSYIVPHWICNNFFIFRSNNEALTKAVTYEDIYNALDPTSGKPLYTSMWGKTSLGEMYADAILDLYDDKWSKQHLSNLTSDKSTKLDSVAKAKVLALYKKLDSKNQKSLERYSNNDYIFPRQFASNNKSALYGYSERMYYAEKELQLLLNEDLPVLKNDSITVKQFSYSTKSNGTPSWVDAFVIPKGKLKNNEEAIKLFIKFIKSDKAYLCFAQPNPSFAFSNLLPASASAYKSSALISKQPLLTKFVDVMDDKLIISESKYWQGMRIAGTELRKELIELTTKK